ncbi:prolyl oligopeptidase family serine peptidase [Pleionea litopenaei]|uniref:Prolyl oligopeptidase family serine peptidase n=1 Tax=Pleionea litopenaei TaxID=3070815 RepID=A0AA51RSR1_9GAMM|nr:prolyl oligopeptidase family serine peptidase [Pleionea sp. HL-JVS1]WMS86926.1 prolyl oligopeptidase family serine peptidase [Pleionea sp. HL-JVS1]
MNVKLTFTLTLLLSWVLSSSAEPLTLKQVMADPDWIGRSPQSPYWSDDSQAIYYRQKQQGVDYTQLMKLNIADNSSQRLSDSELAVADVDGGKLSPNGKRKVYLSQGDIYVKDLENGEIYAVTQTKERESQVVFASDQVIQFRKGNGFYRLNLSNGQLQQLVEVALSDDKESWKEPKDFLGAQQRRLFSYIKEQQDLKQYREQRRKAIAEASPFEQFQMVYLGKNKSIRHMTLSSQGRYLFIATQNQVKDKNDNMPVFVTEDGYVENQEVRPLVGKESELNEQYWVYDRKREQLNPLSLNDLDDIDEDPLESFKKATAKREGKKFKKSDENRAVYIHGWYGNGYEWNADGSRLALKLYSYDNKDRWLVEVDFDKNKLKQLHQLTDNAWVNDWTFNQMGWLNTSDGFYYLSEEDGFSHLYLRSEKGRVKQLTQGDYEVSDLTLSNNDQYIYYRANKKHPGIYEIYRINLANGKSQALTDLNGVADYELSPDEKQLAILYSSTTRPAELYHLAIENNTLKQLTDTVSAEFKGIEWSKPEIVAVPSSHVKQPIYSRLYLPKNFNPARAEKYPAVMFVHGAGYLQNSHHGWSGYFREFMFHSLLNQQGYIVLDMDYRASKGYGRDWRTAIYRQMGTPELEDLLDGKQWLVDNYSVDQNKVGVYGGSYGGFMTFMALFNAPGEFAAGASLRPVTDWSSYNHGYTSNILNTPEVDPEAYNRSSPIEFAQGLQDPLLIAHGMVDDNVFFKDSVRLVQRLIELEKTQYFETAIYPIEPHGFREPSSWLDEYTRIYHLFEKHVK